MLGAKGALGLAATRTAAVEGPTIEHTSGTLFAPYDVSLQVAQGIAKVREGANELLDLRPQPNLVQLILVSLSLA